MVAGRKYWILIWYGILLLGVLGLWASLYWARRTAWKNVDEVLRAVGTILVSVGMLLLLHQPAGPLWSTTGEMDTSIAIRTAVVRDGRLYFSAGGGIVADSDPEQEYQETLDKVRSIIDALASLRPGGG